MERCLILFTNVSKSAFVSVQSLSEWNSRYTAFRGGAFLFMKLQRPRLQNLNFWLVQAGGLASGKASTFV